MKKLLLLLLFATRLSAQTITQQPVNATVQAGQTAVFTLTVSGGPCRSFMIVTGLGSVNGYGPYASTLIYSIFNTTLAMNGWTVQFQLYGCTSGGGNINSNVVKLTVTPAVTLQSLAITTSQPVVGIGQTDALTVNGMYSDGTIKDLTSTAAWTSSAPAVASVSKGAVLGVTAGTATVTAAVGGLSAFTTVTVKPVLTIIFTPTNEDGTIPAASLVVSQIVVNADGTTAVTPLLQLPDPGGATSAPFLYDPALLYQAGLFLNQQLMGTQLVFSPVLLLSVMPHITQMSFAAVLYNGTQGPVKSMSWSAQ